MFVIEDEIHAEWCGKFKSFDEALRELKERALVPWDKPPNVCPCHSWKTCGREYVIIEYDVTQASWEEVSREAVLSVSSKGVEWLHNV